MVGLEQSRLRLRVTQKIRDCCTPRLVVGTGRCVRVWDLYDGHTDLPDLRIAMMEEADQLLELGRHRDRNVRAISQSMDKMRTRTRMLKQKRSQPCTFRGNDVSALGTRQAR